jgi:hypothetical protein
LALAQQGEGCQAANDCAPGLACQGLTLMGSSGFLGTCGVPGAVGATCQGGDCQPDLTCDSTGHCAAIRWMDAGAACDGVASQCVGNAQCNAGTCTLLPVAADGQPCSDNGSGLISCDDFSVCTGGVCVPKPGPVCF